MPSQHPHNSTPSLPDFALPDVVGVSMSPEDRSRVIQSSLEEMAEGLHCTRLLALSYVPRERLVRGVGSVGLEGESIRGLLVPLAEFPLAERALRTNQILTLPNGSTLAARIADLFPEETVVVPLALGGRPLAVLIGLLAPNIAARSASWQDRAKEIAARASLVVELERVSAAYQAEVDLRQSRRILTAAILENRPLSEVAEMIVQIVSERLRVERGALFVRNEYGRFIPAALQNISTEYAQRIMRLPRPGPVMTRAIATGLPYFARNVQEDAQFEADARALFRREGITSILIAALHYGDTYTGALALYPQEHREFTPAELAVFQSFTDQATMAVAITNLLQQQRDMAAIEERNRLAREMHDTVAQSLAALVLQLETAQTQLESGDLESVQEMLAAARIQAKKGLEDTRRAVQGLSPMALERLTPAEAIEEEARRFETEESIPTPFILSGEEQPLLPEQGLALLRIAQEALTNARKYAQAQRVRVGLQYGPERVTLLIEDDGVGFDPAALPNPEGGSGYGLFGMNERMRLLDGALQIDSTPGWGTRIRATLPYHPSSEWQPPVPSVSLPRVETPPPLPSFSPKPPVSTPETSLLRVLVVDDHAVMRQGVRSMLEASGEIEVIGEARDGAEAVTEALRLRPDVILMDLQMPGVDGLEGLRRLQVQLPETPVVILTTFQTQEAVSEALSAGARGFLLKDAEPSDLLAAIRAARRGEALLAPSVTNSLAALASGQGARSDAETLNERELEVLQLVAQGARNKEIATRLFIVPRTVEYHLANIFAKLGVSNRTEASRVALERGLIVPVPRGIK